MVNQELLLGLSPHWQTPFGHIECTQCDNRHPCHLSAWMMNGPRTCEVCGADTEWVSADRNSYVW